MVLLVFFLFYLFRSLSLKHFLQLPLDSFNIDFIDGRYAIRTFCDRSSFMGHSVNYLVCTSSTTLSFNTTAAVGICIINTRRRPALSFCKR